MKKLYEKAVDDGSKQRRPVMSGNFKAKTKRKVGNREKMYDARKKRI